MKRKFVVFLLLTALPFICFSTIHSQTTVGIKDEKLISEVSALRSKLVEAIKRRDQKTLEGIYAEDFTHTHASGQVDGKAKRTAALVSGDLTIESAEVNEISIRIYGTTTAIAVGQSTIPDENKNAVKYRWTITYFKTKNNWQIVASQATRLP